jgi:hypothetical protein
MEATEEMRGIPRRSAAPQAATRGMGRIAAHLVQGKEAMEVSAAEVAMPQQSQGGRGAMVAKRGRTPILTSTWGLEAKEEMQVVEGPARAEKPGTAGTGGIPTLRQERQGKEGHLGQAKGEARAVLGQEGPAPRRATMEAQVVVEVPLRAARVVKETREPAAVPTCLRRWGSKPKPPHPPAGSTSGVLENVLHGHDPQRRLHEVYPPPPLIGRSRQSIGEQDCLRGNNRPAGLIDG